MRCSNVGNLLKYWEKKLPGSVDEHIRLFPKELEKSDLRNYGQRPSIHFYRGAARGGQVAKSAFLIEAKGRKSRGLAGNDRGMREWVRDFKNE